MSNVPRSRSSRASRSASWNCASSPTRPARVRQVAGVVVDPDVLDSVDEARDRSPFPQPRSSRRAPGNGRMCSSTTTLVARSARRMRRNHEYPRDVPSNRLRTDTVGTLPVDVDGPIHVLSVHGTTSTTTTVVGRRGSSMVVRRISSGVSPVACPMATSIPATSFAIAEQNEVPDGPIHHPGGHRRGQRPDFGSHPTVVDEPIRSRSSQRTRELPRPATATCPHPRCRSNFRIEVVYRRHERADRTKRRPPLAPRWIRHPWDGAPLCGGWPTRVTDPVHPAERRVVRWLDERRAGQRLSGARQLREKEHARHHDRADATNRREGKTQHRRPQAPGPPARPWGVPASSAGAVPAQQLRVGTGRGDPRLVVAPRLADHDGEHHEERRHLVGPVEVDLEGE